MNANIPRAIALFDVLISKAGDPDYTDEALRTVVLRYASQARGELDSGERVTTVRRWRPIVIGMVTISTLLLALVLFVKYRVHDWDGFHKTPNCRPISHAPSAQGPRTYYDCGDNIAHWKRDDP